MTGDDSIRSLSFVVTCFAEQSIVAFEPVGGYYELHDGDTLDIEMSGPGNGKMEIALLSGGGITIDQWPGSNVTARTKSGEYVDTGPGNVWPEAES